MRCLKAIFICSLTAAVLVLVPEKATGSSIDEPPDQTQPSHFGTGGMVPLALHSNYASSGNIPPTVNLANPPNIATGSSIDEPPDQTQPSHFGTGGMVPLAPHSNYASNGNIPPTVNLAHPPNIVNVGLNDKTDVPISDTVSDNGDSALVSGYFFGYRFKTDENGDLIRIPLSNGRDFWEGRKPRKRGQNSLLFDDKLPVHVPRWFNGRGRWPIREPGEMEDENIPIRDVFWTDEGFGPTGRQGERHHHRKHIKEPNWFDLGPRPTRHHGERDGIAPQEEPTWLEWGPRPMRHHGERGDDMAPQDEQGWRDWGSKPKRHHGEWDDRPFINLPYDNGVIGIEPRLPHGSFEELNTQRGSTS